MKASRVKRFWIEKSAGGFRPRLAFIYSGCNLVYFLY